MRALVVILAALAFALAPSAASAAQFEGYAAVQQPLVLPLVAQQAVPGMAAHYRLDVQQLCPNGVQTFKLAQEPKVGSVPAAWGAGWHDGTDCELWLTASLLRALADRGATGVYDVIAACSAVWHEAGHALGLPHALSGVMAGALADGTQPKAEPFVGAWAPHFCLRYAVNVDRAAIRRHHTPPVLAGDMYRDDVRAVQWIARRVAALSNGGA